MCRGERQTDGWQGRRGNLCLDLACLPLFQQGKIGFHQTHLARLHLPFQRAQEGLPFLFLQCPSDQRSKQGGANGVRMMAPKLDEQQTRFHLFDAQLDLPPMAIQPEPFPG